MKIIKCKIVNRNTIPEVYVAFQDRSTKKLFHFNPKEINFTEKELVGLTEMQAMLLRNQKERRWLIG